VIALDKRCNMIGRSLQRGDVDIGKGPADRRENRENPNHSALIFNGSGDDGAHAEGTNHSCIDTLISFRILAVQDFSALNAESSKAVFYLQAHSQRRSHCTAACAAEEISGSRIQERDSRAKGEGRRLRTLCNPRQFIRQG
jgi:hypothetical protein